MIRSVLVLGAGSAGLLAAIAAFGMSLVSTEAAAVPGPDSVAVVGNSSIPESVLSSSGGR